MSSPGHAGVPAAAYICETVEDFYSARGRAMVARACRDHLEENRLTAFELMSHTEHARLVMESDTLYGALVQRVAVTQAQQLKQGVRDRAKKVAGLCNLAFTQTAGFEKRLPPGPLTAAALSALVQSDPLYGERIGFAALARHLKLAKTWMEKAERCFDLIGKPASPAADAAALGILEQGLAELLLARTGVVELIGKARNPQHRVLQLLSMLDRIFALPDDEVTTDMADRLSDLNLKNRTPALRDAVMQLLRRLLESSVPLRADEPVDEFTATRQTYQVLIRDRALAVELGVADLIEARMKRLVTRENLAKLIPGAFSGPKLMQAFFLLDQTIGDGAREILLKYITYLLEHRDLEKEFAEPSATQAEKLEQAQAVRGQLVSAGLTDHRRERLVELVDGLIEKIKAGEQRRSPRTICGPEDHVVVEGVKAPLKNWSVIGLLFGPLTNSLEQGQRLALTVRIKSPKITIGFEADCEVVRAGTDGMVAVKYFPRDKAVARTIALYFDPLGAARG